MRVGLKIPEGFAPGIAIYVTGLQYGRNQTLEVIKDLTLEEIARRVLPSVHSIGALALHLGETAFYWIECVVAGREPSEEEKRFAHFFDTMETDVDKGYDAEYLKSRLGAISTITCKRLKLFSDSDLDRYFTRPELPATTEHTLREILQRMIDHEGHHRGQMAMMKRLIRDGSPAS